MLKLHSYSLVLHVHGKPTPRQLSTGRTAPIFTVSLPRFQPKCIHGPFMSICRTAAFSLNHSCPPDFSYRAIRSSLTLHFANKITQISQFKLYRCLYPLLSLQPPLFIVLFLVLLSRLRLLPVSVSASV